MTAFSMEISSSVTAVPQTINVLRHKVTCADYFNKTAELIYTTVFNLHMYKKDNKMPEIWKK